MLKRQDERVAGNKKYHWKTCTLSPANEEQPVVQSIFRRRIGGYTSLGETTEYKIQCNSRFESRLQFTATKQETDIIGYGSAQGDTISHYILRVTD